MPGTKQMTLTLQLAALSHKGQDMSFGTLAKLFPCALAGVVALGCSTQPERQARSLSSGEVVAVSLRQDQTGALHALAMSVEGGDEEDDGIDCEQEGENEGENEGCVNTAPAANTDVAQMIVAPVAAGLDTSNVDVLGIHVNLPASDTPLAGGTYWFTGRYTGTDTFEGTILKTSSNERLRLLGAVDGIRSLPSGMLEVQVLGRTVQVDSSLTLNLVDSVEVEAESDIDCEQEGEHEGENEGC